MRLALPAPPERRRIRRAAGLTLADVGAAVSVSRETVRGWEAGACPRLRHLADYVAALGVMKAAAGEDDEPGRKG
jgi:transcriptional regulator with XRE-family HTH domain